MLVASLLSDRLMPQPVRLLPFPKITALVRLNLSMHPHLRLFSDLLLALILADYCSWEWCNV